MPGVRLNFSKSGVSTSVGGHGLTTNIGKSGTRSTVGVPGTGISYSTQHRPRGPGATGRASSTSSGGAGLGCLVLAGIIALLVAVFGGASQAPLPAADPISSSALSEPAFVTARSANCRTSASATAAIVTKLPRGSALTVVEHDGTWSRIDREPTCWISAGLLGDAMPVEPLAAPQRGHRNSAGAASMMSARRRHRHRSAPSYMLDEGCPCSGRQICIGPRGGRYCITSGGNKRYGV